MPRLYLSPSLQEFNLYAGGGNEEYYMNLLADEMEPYLISSGITYLRSDPATQELQDVIRQSNASDIDLHLALHSNAAGEGKEGQVRGVEASYDPSEAFSRKAAELLAEERRQIDPRPAEIGILPTTKLAEVVRTDMPAVLLEVAYHDNWEDAQWIRDNLGNIAQAVVKGVCAYFGVPFVPPQPLRIGTVHTGGANLNLRRFPSTEAQVLVQIPNNSKLLVYSQIGNGWSVVGFGGFTGYAKSEYII